MDELAETSEHIKVAKQALAEEGVADGLMGGMAQVHVGRAWDSHRVAL